VEVSPMSKTALMFSSKDISGLLHESEIAVQQGDLQRAKNTLQLAIKLAPGVPEPHWRLCQLLEAEGETSAAISEAQRAVSLDDANPHWYLALGWAYSRAGKWQPSFDAFKDAFKRDNNLHDAVVGECYALAKQKQIMLARITLHVSDPEAHDTSWYHAANGLILEEKGDLKGAYDELTRAVEIAPNDYQAKYTLARIAYQLACTEKKKESWKAAAQDARDLLAITPCDVEVLINLGICLSAISDDDGAIKTLANAVRISPNNANAHAAYASVLASAGRTDDAIAQAKIAKKLNPSQKLVNAILQHHNK
jgi:tetratricopeptide (TPR) repeat protein